MKTVRNVLRVAAVLSAFLLACFASDLQIGSFAGNGVLTWTNTTTNVVYRVEWASALNGEWRSSWTPLGRIPPTGEVCSASVPMFYRVIGEQPPRFFLPEYTPVEPNAYDRKVFLVTNFLDGATSLFTNEIATLKRVPYRTGALLGVADRDGVLLLNNGRTVRFLGAGDQFYSSDTNLTSHPACWSFDYVYDGLVVTQEYFSIKDDLSALATNSSRILVRVQSVTLPVGTATNAIVFWHLDPASPYAPLDFHGAEGETGLALPSSGETGGFAAKSVRAYGFSGGFILDGEIDPPSGELRVLRRLRAVLAP